MSITMHVLFKFLGLRETHQEGGAGRLAGRHRAEHWGGLGPHSSLYGARPGQLATLQAATASSLGHLPRGPGGHF